MSSQASAHSADTLEPQEPAPTLRAPTTYAVDHPHNTRPNPALRAGERSWGDRYDDLGLLAMGGMSEVRRARDRVLEREVAVKVLGAHLLRGGTSAQRFRREAALLASLRHPGIVEIFDYGVSCSGRPYLVMPLLQGQTYGELLGRRGPRPGPPPETQLLPLISHLRAVAVAIAAAHAKGFIHRDLKPSNIMVSPEGRVTVLDFGLARLAGAADSDPSDTEAVPLLSGSASVQVTRHGAVQGTVLYMAPEQARGDTDRICTQTDVWGLGAMLCEVLTGVPPFGLGDGRAVLARAREYQRSELAHRTSLAPTLLKLMEHCLQRSPEQRPSSASQVARTLESWLDTQERSQRARQRVSEALAQSQREQAELQTAQALEHELAELRLPEGPERWDIEDRIEGCREDAALAGARAEDTLHAAIELAPELREARQVLCRRLRAQHERAEEAGDTRRARALALRLGRYDDGEHAPYLAAQGSLELWTDRAVEVSLHHWVRRDHRLIAEPLRSLGAAPLIDLPLRAGDYLLELRTADSLALRLPVRVPRVRRLRLGSAARPLRVPSAADLLPGFTFLPAGPARLGGDPRAQGTPLPAQTRDIADACIGTYPVRLREYLAFVEDTARTEGTDAARILLPRPRTDVLDSPTAPIVLRDGRAVRQPDQDGDLWDLDWPVLLIRHEDAELYCAWLARRTGMPTRLPTEAEWEKAARGPFGWVYPWGSARIDPSFAAIHPGHGAHPQPPRLLPDQFPVDCSMYGVRFLAGGVREFVARSPDLVETGECVLRGGDYGSGPDRARGAMRLKTRYGRRGGATGFRVAYSLKSTVSRPS